MSGNQDPGFVLKSRYRFCPSFLGTFLRVRNIQPPCFCRWQAPHRSAQTIRSQSNCLRKFDNAIISSKHLAFLFVHRGSLLSRKNPSESLVPRFKLASCGLVQDVTESLCRPFWRWLPLPRRKLERPQKYLSITRIKAVL